MKKSLLPLAALALTHCFPLNEKAAPVEESQILFSTRDVHVDMENKNTGLGSEVRLYYSDAVAFLGFDQGITVPAGKKVVKAELTLHGWSDGDGDAKVTLDLFETSTDWKEGTGHWYVHGGGFHNGYKNVYAPFPDYVAPANTTNPTTLSGALWSTTVGLRDGMEKITAASAVFPRGNPWGTYPPIENTGTAVFDLTAFLSQKENQGVPLSFGVRQAPASVGPNEGNSWIYSRDHMDHAVHAPKLSITYR